MLDVTPATRCVAVVQMENILGNIYEVRWRTLPGRTFSAVIYVVFWIIQKHVEAHVFPDETELKRRDPTVTPWSEKYVTKYISEQSLYVFVYVY